MRGWAAGAGSGRQAAGSGRQERVEAQAAGSGGGEADLPLRNERRKIAECCPPGWPGRGTIPAMGILIRLVITAVSLWIATLVIDGIRLTTDNVGGQIGTLLAVAVIFGIVNAVLRPIIKTIGCGLYVLTLGLISIVVNGLLFLLASWIAGRVRPAVPRRRLLAERRSGRPAGRHRQLGAEHAGPRRRRRLSHSPAIGLVTYGISKDRNPVGPYGGCMGEERRGYLYGLTAYVLWGFFPIYFKLLKPSPPLEILAHRVIWSVLFISLLLLAMRNWRLHRAAGAGTGGCSAASRSPAC